MIENNEEREEIEESYEQICACGGQAYCPGAPACSMYIPDELIEESEEVE